MRKQVNTRGRETVEVLRPLFSSAPSSSYVLVILCWDLIGALLCTEAKRALVPIGGVTESFPEGLREDQ